MNLRKIYFTKMAYFFNIPHQKVIQLLLFIILLKVGQLQTLENQDVLKFGHELVDSASKLTNLGMTDAKLPFEWMQKNVIGILCNVKFEFKMDKSLQKLQNEFCDSSKNENFQNTMEILQTTKIEKKTFDKSQMDKAIANDQTLNYNNKGMFSELVNFSSKLFKINEKLIEAKKLAVFHQKPKDLLGRRTKRADDNAIKGCISSVLLTLISAPYFGYYSFQYAHEGNVQIEYTECYKHLFSYRCYPAHSSVVTEIVEWTIIFAIGLILALLFCSCARR